MKFDNHKISDHTFFNALFGQSFPSVAHLPNVVTTSDPRPLKFILREIARKGSVCFAAPPYNSDCNGDNDDIEDYNAWGIKSNQDYLREYGCHYPQFVIDSNIDHKLITNIRDTSEDSSMFLVKNIDQYRWFYMPMTDEDSIAIFITRQIDRPWVNQILQKFDNINIPYTQIVNHNNQDTWKLNGTLRNVWRLE